MMILTMSFRILTMTLRILTMTLYILTIFTIIVNINNDNAGSYASFYANLASMSSTLSPPNWLVYKSW